MVLGRPVIFSAFIFGIVLNLVLTEALVSAQPSPSPSPGSTESSPDSIQKPTDSTQPSRRYRRSRGSDQPGQIDPNNPNSKSAENIRSQIGQNQRVKSICENLNRIGFELISDQLKIITGDNTCSYTIIEEILQPQLSAGKIRTYEFTGDREDVIVSF